MRRLVPSIIWLLIAPIMAVASDTDLSEPIPSYREALQVFQEEQAKAPGSPFSEEDRRVMEGAARDLAEAMPDPGLRVGERAPDFSLPNAFGRQVRLTDLLSEGPVVLTFYRGLGALIAISNCAGCSRRSP